MEGDCIRYNECFLLDNNRTLLEGGRAGALASAHTVRRLFDLAFVPK